MKLIIATLALLLSANALADTYVNGYTRKDGTYVQPHYRSPSNSNSYDNYSSKGNSNPYTGKQGTVEPYQSQNFNYNPPAVKQYNNPYDND